MSNKASNCYSNPKITKGIKRNCCVPDCKSNFLDRKKLLDTGFYTFPDATTDLITYRCWLREVRKCKPDAGKNLHCTEDASICELHFRKEDFVVNIETGERLLKKGSVPYFPANEFDPASSNPKSNNLIKEQKKLREYKLSLLKGKVEIQKDLSREKLMQQKEEQEEKLKYLSAKQKEYKKQIDHEKKNQIQPLPCSELDKKLLQQKAEQEEKLKALLAQQEEYKKQSLYDRLTQQEKNNKQNIKEKQNPFIQGSKFEPKLLQHKEEQADSSQTISQQKNDYKILQNVLKEKHGPLYPLSVHPLSNQPSEAKHKETQEQQSTKCQQYLPKTSNEPTCNKWREKKADFQTMLEKQKIRLAEIQKQETDIRVRKRKRQLDTESDKIDQNALLAPLNSSTVISCGKCVKLETELNEIMLQFEELKKENEILRSQLQKLV